MSFTVSYNNKHNIVELKFRGSADLAEHLRARNETMQLRKKHRSNKLLAHLGNLLAQDTITKADQLEFVESWNLNDTSNLSLALVMPEDYDSQNEFYFMVHLSKMKGMNIKTFYSEDLAAQWLQEIH